MKKMIDTPAPQPVTNITRFSWHQIAGFLRRWQSRATRGRLQQPVAASHKLNESIRAGDIEGVEQALSAGASLGACTLDDEGWHSPYELAIRHGKEEIVDLLRATSLPTVLRDPRFPEV